MDPPPWCDVRMELTLPNVHSFQLPDPSWQWVSPRWLIDMTQDVDENGWQYASRFSESAAWHGRHSAQGFVRRRRWLRLRRRYRCADSGGDSGGDSEMMCLNPAALVGGSSSGRATTGGSGRPIIRKAASMIKSKVSGSYVGSSPRSPTSPKAKVLAYTLKDGRYRSHCLKSPAAPPPPPLPMLWIPRRPDSVPDIKKAPSEMALHKRRHHHHHHHHHHHESTREDVVEPLPLPLPLPTGGLLFKRPPPLLLPNELLSATGSVAGTEYSDTAGSPLSAAELTRFPRLSPLAPPVSAVPLDELQRSVSFAMPNPEPGNSVVRRRTSPPLATKSPQSVAEEDAGSTVVASHVDFGGGVDGGGAAALRRKASAVSSRDNSCHSSLGFVDNDLPPLDPYVDPYAHLPLSSSHHSGGCELLLPPPPPPPPPPSELIDERLVGLATESLRAMLAGVRLDRERLEVVRNGLLVGGITAATLWYSLRWLYELMEYDAGRQRLVAAMLEFADTCPRDAPGRLGVGKEVEDVSVETVWRGVLRPLVEVDGDLN
ncbi:hypothetical protein IWW37_002384 [Coemansia sp. RSA 2050]|nr:hypothetical protein IWW37_002384 [Coemansia sp. RSA 2050]